ncbi:HAAS signaling domain-containing protein [Bogoriella caseilytica]|uniref:DUF1700 domain-containing protein n=1 Tax=Bogoriella caseilytica TaxID=56055 RepID=A0A3N2BG12_9MICO|nr:hypothetical protein [Bogoriella caseilytica]ROR74160.1 hypothetical protein EDD31_2560 [Bogoriella caseilytica]
MSTETVSTYLNQVTRMLGGVDPAYRADVLAGVHDHLEAALGPEPWREQEVRHVLDDLGPPEEIAAAALDGQPTMTAEPPSAMSGAWVPPVAVALVAIGTFAMLLLLSGSYGLGLGSAGSGGPMFEPVSLLWSFPVVLLSPPAPLALVGALLVTLSPLYRGVDRLAAWLALPWCLALLGWGAFILRAVDECVRTGSSFCTGIGADTVRLGGVAVVLVASVGLVLLLARLARVRTTGTSDAGRWWTAAGVVLALLVSTRWRTRGHLALR